MEPVRQEEDDHPEPEFRPLSVGQQVDGHLIPLTLSILLLSLDDVPRSPQRIFTLLPTPTFSRDLALLMAGQDSFAGQQRRQQYRSEFEYVLPKLIPDLPTLAPTLIGGLPPLRLWLSMPEMASKATQARQIKFRTASKLVLLPVLHPVSTSVEEPMTPLCLSGPGFGGYFDELEPVAER